jgi:hypothetical protein
MKAPREKNQNLGPLIWEEADNFLGPTQELEPTLAGLLEFLCSPDLAPDLARFKIDYDAASRPEIHNPVFRAPYKPEVLNRLVWPLRHAKASFMLGNYLGAIALCGLVAEMAAILLWEFAGVQIKGVPMDNDSQVGVFGSRFERLGQERRISALKTFGIVDDEVAGWFTTVKDVRRNYLHFFSTVPPTPREDALRVYSATLAIAFHIIGPEALHRQDIHDMQIARLMMAHARESRPIIVRERKGRTMTDPKQGTWPLGLTWPVPLQRLVEPLPGPAMAFVEAFKPARRTPRASR